MGMLQDSLKGFRAVFGGLESFGGWNTSRDSDTPLVPQGESLLTQQVPKIFLAGSIINVE